MPIIEITDLSLPELQVYHAASENQLLSRVDPTQAVFIAESPYVIELALAAGCEPLSMLLEQTKRQHPLVDRCKGIPVYTAKDEVLQGLTGYKLTFGMLCAMRRPKMKTVAQVCAKARRLVILEHVMNPTNVGAIFRCAAALGMDGVLLSRDCADPLYRRAARVSMGTVHQLPWAYFEEGNYADHIDQIRSLGFATVAMALREDSLSLRDGRLQQYDKLAVLMGSEGTGLTSESIAACDHTVMIPMHHGVDSLNVAAAAALAFWELGKRE